jgi:hypothetical protein
MLTYAALVASRMAAILAHDYELSPQPLHKTDLSASSSIRSNSFGVQDWSALSSTSVPII